MTIAVIGHEAAFRSVVLSEDELRIARLRTELEAPPVG